MFLLLVNHEASSIITRNVQVLFRTVLKLHSRLSHHLHSNNILVTEQYGFRKGVSTDNPALSLTDSVFKSTNQKMNVKEFSVILQRLVIE